MKKIFIQTLHWVFILPIPILILLYSYWFLFIPMEFVSYNNDFGNFSSGLFSLVLYGLASFLLKQIDKNKKPLFFFYLLIIAPIATINSFIAVDYIPNIVRTIEFKQYKYYVVSGSGGNIFYKCKEATLNCKMLYRSPQLTVGSIEINTDDQEVNLLSPNESYSILFTDGEHPRKYITRFTMFGKYNYNFSEKCNSVEGESIYFDQCPNYIYVLYQCNLEYKNCKRLLLQYITEDFLKFPIIEVDSQNNTLLIYDDLPEFDGKLIAIYGETLKCYVEGCEILGE